MARLRDRLLAHGELADSLLGSLQAEGFALTLLFAGPSGVGKALTAQALAQGLLCETSSAGCGRCGSCLRVEQGAHEGMLIVRPEGTQIKIDQARSILEFLHLRKISRSRIVIIDQAHLLNPQASNALLKVLEEPPEGTFIFLIAPSPSSVLPTLRSRSRTVLFRPLTETELKRIQMAPDWAIKAARGSVETLKALLEPDEQEQREESVRVLEAFLAESDFLTASSWRGSFKEKGFFRHLLKSWTGLIRDGFFLKAGGEALLMNPDQKKALSLLASQPLEKLDSFVQHLIRLDAEMVFNRDPQLAMEELWVTWHRERMSS